MVGVPVIGNGGLTAERISCLVLVSGELSNSAFQFSDKRVFGSNDSLSFRKYSPGASSVNRPATMQALLSREKILLAGSRSSLKVRVFVFPVARLCRSAIHFPFCKPKVMIS